MELTHLTVPQWHKYDGLLHGFTGRRGGKSVGRYAGLNVSYRVGDDNKVVSQNVCDVKLAMGIHDGKIVTMQQVHGDNLIEVTDKKMKEAGEADGMVTAENGVFLGVLTADCVPLFFIAPKQRLGRGGPRRLARHACGHRRKDRATFLGAATMSERATWKWRSARPSACAATRSTTTSRHR